MFDWIRKANYRRKIRQLAKELIEHADKDELYEKLLLKLQGQGEEKTITNNDYNKSTNMNNNIRIKDKCNDFGYYDKKSPYLN